MVCELSALFVRFAHESPLDLDVDEDSVRAFIQNRMDNDRCLHIDNKGLLIYEVMVVPGTRTKITCETYFYVDKPYRGTGIGQELVNRLCEIARDNGSKYVSIEMSAGIDDFPFGGFKRIGSIYTREI